MSKALEGAYRSLGQRVSIPGFRRGKTPREVLERYVGKEALLNEAIERLVPQTYRQVVQEKGIKAVAPPVIQVEEREPLSFTAMVSLKPEVKLGDYRGLKIEAPLLVVTPEDVNRVLEELRYDQAPWEPVVRPVQQGDLAIIDVEGRVEGQLYVEEKGFQYQVKPAPLPFPGLAEKVEGMTAGEEREFNLPFSQGHTHQGKERHFRVRLSEVKGRQPLPLDDALAQGMNLADLAALRQEVERQLKARTEAEMRRELERRVVEAVVAQAEVEYPPVLVEREVEHQLRRQGLEANEERVRQLQPLVVQEVVHSLVLGRVAEVEEIEVSEDEIEAEVSLVVKEKGKELEKLFSAAPARQSLREALLWRKTLDHLIKLTSVEKEAKSGD